MILDSLLIENYRLLRSLQLPRLGDLNLIVGRNGTGKSAILEAIQLYIGRGWPPYVDSVLRGRQELWDAQVARGEEASAGRVLRHLFNGHQLPSVGAPGIRIGSVSGSSAQIHLCVAAFREQRDADGSVTRVRVPPDEVGADTPDIKLYFALEEGDVTRRIIPLDDDFRNLMRRWFPSRPLPRSMRQGTLFAEGEPVVRVVPASAAELDRIAALWDSVALTDLEKEIVAALRLVVPDADGVAVVQEHERPMGDRIPIIKLSGASEPVAMRSMGDGLYRLFHISLATVCSAGGVVLIDEFENGLHWTVQHELWRVLFRLARSLKVQVFATTHSSDCARGFASAWREFPEMATFYRLEITDGDVSAVAYDPETLLDSLQSGVEFR
jgi:hypothetical protein